MNTELIFEVLCIGIFLGGILIRISDYLLKKLDQKLQKDQLELDMTLGKALLEMKKKLEDVP